MYIVKEVKIVNFKSSLSSQSLKLYSLIRVKHDHCVIKVHLLFSWKVLGRAYELRNNIFLVEKQSRLANIFKDDIWVEKLTCISDFLAFLRNEIWTYRGNMIIYFNMLNYLWVAKHFLIEDLNVVALINIPEINE